jgi:hypothetical protein
MNSAPTPRFLKPSETVSALCAGELATAVVNAFKALVTPVVGGGLQ